MRIILPFWSRPAAGYRTHEDICAVCHDVSDRYVSQYTSYFLCGKWEITREFIFNQEVENVRDVANFIIGNCGHAIHKDCYDETLDDTCPTCRRADWLKGQFLQQWKILTVVCILGALISMAIFIAKRID